MSENEIQMEITKEALRLGLLFHADGNGNYVNESTAARKKLMGSRAGWPDMCFILNGRTVWIELKTSTGRLSKEQKIIHAHMASFGCEVHTVYAENGKDGWKKVKELLGV